jgi:hypothetical protein
MAQDGMELTGKETHEVDPLFKKGWVSPKLHWIIRVLARLT